jgi:acyl dehydratase
MPIDPDAAGFVSAPVEHAWTSTDCLLYALGVGAGTDELAYSTENSRGIDQKVYPTMAVTLSNPAREAWKAIGRFDWAKLVHGGQDVELHRPLPVEGRVNTVTEIIGVYDKGKAAIVEFELRAADAETADPVFTTRWRLFIRDEGGFGCSRGTPPEVVTAPDRLPDHSFEAPTARDQALLYRLSGDRNPLHSDPAFAQKAGFERPILHGLCTYGVTGRVLLRERCQDDPQQFTAMSARFSSPVYPGDRLIVDVWETPHHDYFRTRRGDDVVLDEGVLTRR